MLCWALIYFVLAVAAALYGWSASAGAAAPVAMIMAFIFLIVALMALGAHFVGRSHDRSD